MPINDLEYVGLEHSQVNFGKKNILYMEMELLTALKHYTQFKKLRKQEFALKNLLQKEIFQIKEELKKMDNYLPNLPSSAKGIPNLNTSLKKRDTLEDEINEIKRQISQLDN
ncbi:MAG: hypothetical protein Q8P57_00495 [Candidatus Pacearchaeota archaeon]|nr:hypothetical protein [Candidatus Pacearchaeota archaeon]